MSLSNFLERLRERILKRRVLIKPRPTGKLRVTRLEERKLLDASFGLGVAGALTLDGFAADPIDGSPLLTMGSSPGALTFELQNDTWAASDVAANPAVFSLTPDNKTLTVNTLSAAVTGINVLAGNGVVGGDALASIDDGPNGIQVSSLTITNGGDVSLDSNSNDFDSISVQGNSLTLADADDVVIDQLTIIGDATITAGGSVTDDIATTIVVGGDAEFSGASITLGDSPGDSAAFGTLKFVSVGDVSISEADDMDLAVGSSGATVTLAATGDIDGAVGTNITATTVALTANDVGLAASSIGSNGEVTTDVAILHASSGGDQHVGDVDSANLGLLSSGGTINLQTGTFLADLGTSVTGTIDLGADATLGGTGNVGDLLLTDGGLSPGNSPGILNTGDFNLGAAANLDVEIDGTTVGTEYDQVNVTGSVTLAGSLTVISGFTAAANDSFTIIDNDGTADAVSGTFAGLAEGAIFVAGGEAFQISYVGGDGNDVVLTSARHVYDFNAANVSGGESGSIAATLNRSGNTSVASSVEVVIGVGAGASAAETTDFTAETVTVNFAAGATSASVDVDITADTIVEDNELVSLTLQNFSAGGSAGVTNASSTVTISNDDTATLTISNVAATETNADQNLTATVTLSAAVEGGISVAFASAAVTAENTDFTVAGTSVAFDGTAGEEENISVTVNGDQIVEDSETFTITLGDVTAVSAVQDAAITTGAVSNGSITNDDTATLSIGNSTVNEAAGTATFTITSSNASERDLSFDVGLSVGTATGSDVTLNNSSATINGDGSTTATTVTVSIADDQRVEGSESYSLSISDAQYGGATDANRAVIGTATGNGVVTDNDTATVSFDAAANSVDEDNTTVSTGVTLTLNTSGTGTVGLDQQVSIDVDRTAGSATIGGAEPDAAYTDTTLTFAVADGASFGKTVDSTIFDDIQNDAGETVVLSLQDLADGTAGQVAIGTSTHTLTITDDDSAATATLDLVSGEGDVEVKLDSPGGTILQVFVDGVLKSSRLLSSISQLTINGTVSDEIVTVDASTGAFDTAIVFNGGDGADILRVRNPTAGVYDPTGGITFNGNDGADTLELLSGTATTIEHQFVNNSDGSVFYNGEATATVVYTGLAPVIDTITATTRIFTFTGGAETIDVTDAAAVGQTTIDSTLGESVTFVSPSAQLTINAGTGNDIINITGIDSSMTAAITINGDAGTDVINLGTDLSLGSATSTGDAAFNVEATNLTADVTISTSGGGSTGDLTFNSTLDGAFGLTANVDGITTFASTVGASTALDVITTDAAGSVVVGGNVSAATIDLNETANLALTADAEFDAAIIDIEGGVSGAFTLILDGSTSVNVAGTIGTTNLTIQTAATVGSVAIAGDLTVGGGQLTTNVGAITVGGNLLSTAAISGATSLSVTGTSSIGGNVTTAGEQSYSLAVTQTANVVYTAADTDADFEGIDFGSTLAGGGNSVTVVGGAGFASTVSGVTTLVADHIDSESTIAAASVSVSGTSDLGGNVTTSGLQNYDGAVLLTGAATLASSGNAAISLDSTVDGAFALVVNTTGVTTFGGAVGGLAALTSLTTNAGGTTAINGGAVTTSGAQAYNNSVTLGANTATTGGGLTFGSTVDGDFLLTADGGAGNVVFAGGIGGTTKLSGLVVDGANVDFDSTVGVDDEGLDVDSMGTMSFDAAVSTMNGGMVTLSNGGVLTLAAAADFNLNGAFVQDGTGTVTTAADIVTTGNAISFASAVTQSGAVLLDTTNGGTSATGASVALNTVAGGGNSLTLNGGNGGAITSAQISAVDTLTITDSGSAIFSGTVSAATIAIADTTGDVTFNDAVTATSLTAAASTYGVVFNAGGTITNAVTFNNTGGVTFGNGVGDTINFTNGVTSTTSTTVIQGTLNTINSNVTFGATTLADATTINTGAGGGTVSVGQVTGGTNSLAVNSGTGDVVLSNAANVIGDLTVTAAAVTIAEADDITQAAAWTTTGTTTLDADSNDITLTNAANQFGTLNLTAANATLNENADIAIGAAAITTTINLTSTGAINDATSDVVMDITATSVVLTAAAGIGATEELELSATNITATTTNGNIDLDSTLASAVNVATMVTGSGTIDFDYAGAAGVTFSGPVTSGGGAVTLTSDSGLVVDAVISSAGAAGGTLSVSGATLNASPVVGANITIAGGSVDTIVTADLANAGNLTLSALRDVLISGDVSTTAGGDITITADADGIANADGIGSALGGAFIAAGGQLESAGTVDVSGSDLLNGAAIGTGQSILIAADGTNNQVVAVGDVTLIGNVVGGMADIVINGFVTSTTGDIAVTSADEIQTASTLQATAGSIEFNDAVVLTGGTTIIAAANATFDLTVDGAFDLSLDVDGATTFAGAVGATSAVGDGLGAAISLTGDGTTEFQSTAATGSGITQANNAAAVTFRNDITAAAGDTGSAFDGDVVLDGLTFTSAGTITFGNAATDTVTTSAAAVIVTTAAANENVVFNAATTANTDLTVSVATGGITVNAEVDGNSNVVYNSAGTTDINAAIGSTTAVASLTTDAPGTTTLAANVSAQGGTITINDALVLNTNITLADSGTSGISLNNTVDSDGTARNLTLTTTNAAAAINIGDAAADTVGGTSALGQLTVNAAGTLTQRANIEAAAGLTYDATGAITVTGSTAVAGNVDVDSAATIGISNSITTTAGGTVDIDGTGLTTLTSAADINADGAVEFGAAKTGGLSTAANVTTTNDNITFNQAVTLAGPVVLNSGAAAGNVTFASPNGTVDGAQDLTISAGTGNIEFDSAIGSGTALVDLNITSANQINFDAAVTAATVTANGTTIDGNGLVTATTIDLDAVNGIGATTALNLNAVTLDATNTTSGIIHINEVDNVAVGVINNGARNVTLNAGGNITDGNGGTTNVTAGVFTVDAAGGIDLDTDITSLDASTSAAGNIDINEANAISLTDVDTSNGSITVSAAGAIAAVDVNSSATDSDANDVSLTTTAGDISVTTINAGAAGDVTLDSAAAITEDGNPATLITADELTVDAAGAIALDTTVASANISTTAAGDIDIDETDGITLTDVDTSDGSITVTAAGSIIATDVAAAGAGSDVVLNATAGDIQAILVTAADAVTVDSDVGNVTVGSITATTIATVTADAGSINDVSANPDLTTDITATTVDLNADLGIGNTAHLELAATNVSADTTSSGNIDIDNVLATSVTVTSLTSGNGDIRFDQSGGGDVTFTGSVDSGSGGMTGGNITLTATAALTVAGTGTVDSRDGAGGALILSGATINGAVIVGGGDVTIQGGGFDLIVAADLTADEIALTAARDVIVSAAVDATNSITVTADTNSAGDANAADAAGGVWIQTAGRIDSSLGSVTITGSDVFATAGAVDSVLIDSDGANNQIEAGQAIAIGDGTNAPSAAATIINGRIETLSATHTIDITAEGGVQFGADGDVVGQGGAITVTADTQAGANGGAVTMADGATIQSTSGTITVTADGNISIGQLSNTSSIVVTTDNGMITDAGDASGADIITDNVAFTALTGIGADADAIESQTAATSSTLTLAATTDSGDIHVSNSGSLTVGTSGGVVGVTIVDDAGAGSDAQDSTLDNISLVAASPLTVTSAITNNDGSNITLTSTNDGGLDDHLTINAALTITGGDATQDATGNIDLNAGTDLVINSTASTDAAGTITGLAARDVLLDSGTLTTVNGDASLTATAGQVAMVDGTAVQSTTGDVDVIAQTNVAVSSITTTADTAVTATTGAISDNGDGAIDVAANTATFNAATGIGNGDALETTVNTLNATNTASGTIQIAETDDLAIDVVNNAARNVTILAGGDITDANAAAINVTAGVFTVDAAGGIDLDTTISSLDATTSATGDIDINETDAITLTDVDTADGMVTVVAGGTITAVDVNSSTVDDDSNDISLTTTSGDILVGLVNAGSQNDVALTADGAISESGSDAAVDLLAGDAQLVAATGIGSGNAIETTLSNLAFSNTTSGAVQFTNSQSLTIAAVGALGASSNAAGNIELCVTAGNLAINSALTATGNTIRLGAAGNVTQSANGVISSNDLAVRATGDILLATATALNNVDNIFAAQSTTAGQIQFADNGGFTVGTVAAAAVNVGDCFTATVGVQTAAGDVQLSSDAGDIIVNDNVTAGGAGDVTLTTTTSGNVTVTAVITSANTVTINSVDEIVGDSTNTAADIVANTVDLTAVNGIGDTPELELAATNISAVTTNGDIDLDNALATATTVSNLQAGTGTITFDQSGGGAVEFTTVSTTDGTIDLGNAGSDLTVGTSVTAGGTGDLNLTTTGAGDVVLAGVATAAGNTITINSADQIVGDAVNTAADLVATNLDLTAVNGIGVAQPLETSVANLTFSNTTGPVQISNDQSLNLGAATTAGDFEMCLTAGDLTISDTLSATGGTVRLQTSAGSVIESGGGEILATNLGVNASGDITLGAATNAVNVFAAESTGGSIVFTEVDGFEVDFVLAGDCFDGANGVQTSFDTGTITVTSGGNLTTFGIIKSVNGDTEINVTSGFLIISGSVMTAGGAIDVNTVGPASVVSTVSSVSGDIDITSTGNFVDNSAPITTDSGDITVFAGSGVLSNNEITSTSGDIDISSDFIMQNDSISTGVSGTITVSATSTILMNAGASATTDAGAIVYSSGGSAVISQLTTGSGDIDVDAIAGTADLNELIQSTSGSIDVTGDNVTQDANITTGSTGTIDVTADNGDITMADGTVTTSADGNITYDATNNIGLSQITTSANVIATADSDSNNAGAITDNLAGEAANITADEVALRAADGIGAADDIDTNVRLLAAETESGSILLHEIDASGVIIGTTDGLSGITITDTAATLNSGNDHIVVRSSGDITVDDAVTNSDQGNILLSAEAAGSGITANSAIATQDGNVVLSAVDNIVLDETVSTTATGTVHVVSSAGSIAVTDADSSSSGITATGGTGDILLQAATTISLGDNLDSGTGDVGIEAGGAFSQLANVSVTTDAGNAIVTADSISMATGSSITTGAANGDILLNSTTGDITVESLNAGTGHVAIDSAADIVDQAAGETNNVTAATLQLTAAGSIGAADLANLPTANGNAINTSVDTLAATAASGIYVRETNGITVGTTSTVSVTVDANNLSLNGVDAGSTTQQTGSDALTSDVTTTGGPIKIVADAGNITINDGDADGFGANAGSDGDVLLEARTNSVVVNSDVRSATGHITLVAADDIDLNEDVRTGGSGTIFLSAVDQLTVDDGADADTNGIVTAGGNVLVQAASATINADINTAGGDFGIELTGSGGLTGTMNTAGGDVLLRTGGDLTLDSLVAGTGTVQIEAGGNVIDGNDGTTIGTLNIAASSLRINSGGSIGSNDAFAADSVNANAIDVSVTTLAANSDSGIYIQETDGLIVDAVASIAVDVQQVHFNSTDTAVNSAAATGSLADLTTAINGPIKVVSLAGDLQLNEGGDGDGHAVSAAGSGDVLIEARTAGDVIVTSAIESGSGHITLDAADDVLLNSTITTGGSGTVYLLAANANAADAAAANVDGVNIAGAITTVDGDILAESSNDILQTALITSTSGDFGHVATNDVVQTASGDITTVDGDVLIDAGNDWTMDADAVITAGGQDVLGLAGNNITLGVISLTDAGTNRIALRAGADIIDGNSGSINIQETIAAAATSVSLRAGSTIGSSDLVSGNGVDTNSNAIDLNVDTVAAMADDGIYLRQIASGGDIEINTAAAVTVSVDSVVRSNFNSTTDSVAETRSEGSLESLFTRNTTGGAIKLVAEDGTITVNESGTLPGSAVFAGAAGDVLLEARGINSDVIVNAQIAGSGNITLDADDDISVNSEIYAFFNGTIYLLAQNQTASDAAVADGINVDSTIESSAGDILLESSHDIRQNALISSLDGDIGLVSTNDVTQTSTGDISTFNGDVLIEAGNNWTMAGHAIITAGGQQVLGSAGGNIVLGVISATNINENHIALSAGGSITDANAGAVNVAEAFSTSTTTLSLRAGTIIGGTGGGTATVNDDAIDLDIDTIAASAADGIFLREIALGRAIEVNTVDAVLVDIEGIVRTNFDSSTSDVSEDRSIASLEDLTTTAGPVKLVAEAGAITINGGADAIGVTAGGASNVLLEARTFSDVIINADVSSSGGHITVNAADDVDVNAAITTSGAGTVYVNAGNAFFGDTTAPEVDGINIDGTITTADGDVLLNSAQDIRTTQLVTSTTGDVGIIAAGDIVQENDGDITTGGDVLVEAGNDWTMAAEAVITATGGEVDGHAVAGDLTLGLINSRNVALTAEGSIVDANAGLLNVDATTLSLRANTGLIGNHDNPNGTPTANVNAIDTQVTTLAVNAEAGVYISEADAVVVDAVNSVTVNVDAPVQVNFNNTITAVDQSRTTAALEDLSSDANGPVKLQTVAGSLTVNGGTDGTGVVANGMGDVLLQAIGSTSDVVVNAAVSSGTGNITLNAGDDIDVNSTLTTTGTGSVFLTSAAATADATAGQADGITLDAALTTAAGDVLLTSAQDIAVNQAINSTSGNVGLIAAQDITQANAGDITTGGDVLVEAGRHWMMSPDAVITANGGEVDGHAIVGNINLGRINSTNVAVTAGQSIFDSNAAVLNIDAITVSLRSGNGEIGTNADAIDTQVTTLAANAETGIYILEADDLVIDTVAAVTVNVDSPVQVNFNSTTTDVADTRTTASLEDLTTESNGPIKVVAGGSLTVNGGFDTTAVSANGTGNILLDANGGDLIVNDNVQSGTGHITLEAAGQLNLGAATGTPVVVQTGGAGSTVAIAEAADIVMQPDALLTTVNGSIHAEAATDVVVGRISTLANVAINAIAGSVTDADAAADSQVDITAQDLRLTAGATLGQIAADNAIETQVATLAALSNGEIHISETDALVVGSVEVNTQHVDFNGNTTAIVDATLDGVDSTANDILLKTGGTLDITQQLNAGSADVRIVSGATISQTATGIVMADELGVILDSPQTGQNIELGNANNVLSTLAVNNTSESGSVTVFESADDLVIGQISSQPGFAVTTGVDANAGDINITAESDLTVTQNIDAAHATSSTSIDESITLISRNGDFVLNDNIVVTSDENPAPGIFDDVTGDQITIIAGSGGSNGIVRLGDDIEVRTDGGVAKQVAPRPTAFAAAPTTGAESAFVTLSDAETMRSNLLFVNGDFLGQLELVFGVAGEENLEVVIDWGVVAQTSLVDSGPAGNATQTTPGEFAFGLDDGDKSIFFIDEGGAVYTIPHLYDPAELLTTANDRNGRQDNPNIIGVRFSVAQHESINIWGENATDPAGVPDTTPPTFQQPAVDDAGNPIVPDAIADATGTFIQPEGQLALLSSTDPNGLRNFSQEATNQSLPLNDNRVVTSTGRPEGQAEWEFLAGPSPGLVPVEQFAQQTFEAPLVEIPAIILTATEVPGDINLGDGAAGDSAAGTEVYLQIRRHFESDAEAEVVIPRITDNSFIANRDSFEQFVEENPVLQDGDGYEVWLITETGGQKVARPIVEFEITGGRPGPATEELPDTFEPYELKELEFEQPLEDSPEAKPADPQANPKQDDDLALHNEKVRQDAGVETAQAATAPGSDLEAERLEEHERLDSAAIGVFPLIGLSRAARWKRRQKTESEKLSRSSRAVRRMRQMAETDSGDNTQ